jgi:hypothetical protein
MRRVLGGGEMNDTLNEADRKRLLTFLEEHDHDFSVSYPGKLSLYCAVCDTPDYIGKNHDFTTPDDRQVLCEALMGEGKWWDFHRFVSPIFRKETYGSGLSDMDFSVWLLVKQPERCCKLVSTFLEVEEK